MGYTITAPDGSYAMRVTRVRAGQYHLNVNIAPLATEVFFKSLKEVYDINEQPRVEGDRATLDLQLRLLAYQFERDHLCDSLANLYDMALSIHQNQYYFTPRISQ